MYIYDIEVLVIHFYFYYYDLIFLIYYFLFRSKFGLDWYLKVQTELMLFGLIWIGIEKSKIEMNLVLHKNQTANRTFTST